MKQTLIVLALLILAVPALAATGKTIPAKSEMAVSGSYAKPKGADAVWAFDGQLAMPADAGGHFLLGPKVHLDSDGAKEAAGVVAEVNFAGTAKSGLYVGPNALYNLKAVAGTERYTVNLDGGIKFALGKGGSGFKLFAEKGVAGRDKDNSVSYNAGLLVRF